MGARASIFMGGWDAKAEGRGRRSGRLVQDEGLCHQS